MPIVLADSRGLAAEEPGAVLVGVGESVSVGRVIMVVMGFSSVVVGGGRGVGVVVGVAVVVGKTDVEVGEVLVVVGLVVGGMRVRVVRSPGPKMSLVTSFIAEPMGSMISEYSDWSGAAMLEGRAEMKIPRTLVSSGSLVAVDGLDPDSAPTWLMAVRSPPISLAVLVAPVMFAGSGSRSMVSLSLVEL